jgi:hypothetical protein
MSLFTMYFIGDSMKERRRHKRASRISLPDFLTPIAQCLTLTSRLASRRTFSPVLEDAHPGARCFRRRLPRGCRRWFLGVRSLMADRLLQLFCNWHFFFLLFKA